MQHEKNASCTDPSVAPRDDSFNRALLRSLPQIFMNCHVERSETSMQLALFTRHGKNTQTQYPSHVPRSHNYFVYIMANRSKTLYVGVTNNIIRRVAQHKSGTGSEFCAHCKLDRLVYLENFHLALSG